MECFVQQILFFLLPEFGSWVVAIADVTVFGDELECVCDTLESFLGLGQVNLVGGHVLGVYTVNIFRQCFPVIRDFCSSHLEAICWCFFVALSWYAYFD